ncbi:YbhB/YbcL family Raf kinase inhibitor-like protein [Halomonas sp. McH1-25]|uniref:YbhB/YbcL family Raf kinase inhibitor-like protein n=1 Tax=unclassified Halomonas TaxID=2609666 RepID=UPI001EF5AF87|nr:MULTISPECIES: YbhB/YbcL family Raf kinase inhibitor-like protein [unclassified Halomonas]MCG7601236.1 YbhB/YbcL family Raf kinase inhibitor-like protein [Halomonas sp. McH1-25]MCP1343694.1 YbhB/YbcL family Raf kinase inhibitor-like protein [Halomonas sp. FL8]MCP1362116.1 YbhB/YbcL family Raf kinase inhibitor-like protein [Halomonas sp. BBD45]MCP1366142.1 YbhB/YbcL family Raf kinase inhibitor-like protein [Halomonas sp. BBD48]
MKLTVQGIEDQQPIPETFAFGVPGEGEPMTLGANRNPALTWSEVPDNTRSFAVLVVDPDVPGDPSDVNQEGKTLPPSMARVDFYHWVVVDIPGETRAIGEGEDSDGVTPKGKAPGQTSIGLRGINTFTDFLAGDPDMGGTYGGYDGPCPPWNDEQVHHYHFTVYALDIESLGLAGEFTGEDARKAMEGHILDQATVTGTYTLNPDLRK